MFDVSVEMLCNLKDCGWEIYDYCVRKEPLDLDFHKGNAVVEIQYDLRNNRYTFATYFAGQDCEDGVPALTYEDMFIFTKLMNELEVKALDKRRAALKEASKCILQK